MIFSKLVVHYQLLFKTNNKPNSNKLKETVQKFLTNKCQNNDFKSMVLSKLSYLPINSHLAVSNKGLLDTGRFRELGKMPDFAHFQRNHSLN